MIITFLNKNSLIVWLLIFCISNRLSPQTIPFKHLSIKDGLSNNFINNVIQDKEGFLWFTTDDGLNRFDGYEFKIFRNDVSNKNTISDNATFAITEDNDGKIWIGTKNGFINCYDPVYNKFTKWDLKSAADKDNPINIIMIDKSGNAWAGTYRNGLYFLNPTTGEIKNWRLDPDNPKSLSNNYVSSLVMDNNDNLWIGTFHGLNKFNPSKSESIFSRYLHVENNSTTLSHNTIWAITKSRINKNTFYIGTANGITLLNSATEELSTISIANPNKLMFGTGAGTVIEDNVDGERILWINSYAGLIRYNQSRLRFDRFLTGGENVNSLSSNQINNIFKDRSGVMWIATDNGLNYFSNKNIKFNSAFLSFKEYIEVRDLNKLNIKAIEKTSDGVLWFGTDKGLYFSAKTNDKTIIKKYSSFAYDNIWSLAAGKENELWVGTYGSGLFLLNCKTNMVKRKPIVDKIIKSSSREFIKSLYTDNYKRLWVGFWGVGLARLDLKTGEIKHWLSNANDNSTLSYDDVWIIFQDSRSRVWIGTNGGGLNCFDESGEKFLRINSDNKSEFRISSNSVYSIAESNKQIAHNNSTVLWIGTSNGLNKIVIADSSNKSDVLKNIKTITTYTTRDGLVDNSIKSIVEDDNGNLWIGTSSGITFFDVVKNSFTNFSSSDGVIGLDFNLSSSLKNSTDLIMMGSTAGLNIFKPGQIYQSEFSPQIVITDIQIFNNSIEPGSNSILEKTIFNTDNITLAHTQNVFSLQFSAFDYNSPSSINYAYKMEGFDKDWIMGGTRRFITYTNLNPGNYTFKVKSTNSDGVWCDNTRSFAITITPPWWQTSWAILLYFVVFIAGIWGIIKFQTNRARLQQELKMREFEAYHLKEVEQMKSRFFANISHEFRTPLMLIKGPIEELLRGRIKDNLINYYKMILQNTEKLQQLIDQLLDLSKLESESIPLKKEYYDLINLTRLFTNAFIPLAQQKNIKLSFNSNFDSTFALLDKDKYEKIINNLLNNAFKFTEPGGIVSVEISKTTFENKQTAQISICDSGIGISKDNQSKIFNRFFQVDDSTKRNFGGSGIGLSLVKELINLHGWDIYVNSEENEGAEFVLTIPLLSEDEEKKYSLQNVLDTGLESVKKQTNDSAAFQSTKIKPTLLLVEDSGEVRNYVEGLLKQEYNVLEAENGKIGFEKANNSLPDLVISDVMMPVMDGFELCKKLKSDWKTSHIPVILLTAKATQQSKLEGLEFGADDYLTKPFDFEELSIRIKNLITQRKLLREKFSKDINASIESITTNTFDKEFLEKINKIIEKHLQDENFTSELLAEELFVSRSQLNRKLNAIVGQGPGEFIRIYKLKRSAQMILENKLSITQIALEVGFSSPAQFTRAFQKHFNCLPSEFLSNNKNYSHKLFKS